MSLLLPLFLVSTGLQAASSTPAPSDPPIVVTGDRPERNPRGGVEAPYPETVRVPLGSRIARRVPVRPFRSVASESGLAGLVGVRGMGQLDGTGGSGHGVRTRLATECIADHDQVSEEVACILFRVDRSTGVGDFNAAAEALAPLLERRHMTAWERYYVGHYAYALAEAAESDAGRERALGLMLASERMAEEERLAALQARVAIALGGNDDQAAISRLTELAEAAREPRTLANLAALYQRNGRVDDARRRMAEAVALTRQRGDAPPEAWVAFLAAPH